MYIYNNTYIFLRNHIAIYILLAYFVSLAKPRKQKQKTHLIFCNWFLSYRCPNSILPKLPIYFFSFSLSFYVQRKHNATPKVYDYDQETRRRWTRRVVRRKTPRRNSWNGWNSLGALNTRCSRQPRTNSSLPIHSLSIKNAIKGTSLKSKTPLILSLSSTLFVSSSKFMPEFTSKHPFFLLLHILHHAIEWPEFLGVLTF